MTIYVTNKLADQLLKDVMTLSGETNKTDVIIDALREKKASLEKTTPLSERIAPLQAQVASRGPADPNFDMKTFSDDMSGE